MPEIFIVGCHRTSLHEMICPNNVNCMHITRSPFYLMLSAASLTSRSIVASSTVAATSWISCNVFAFSASLVTNCSLGAAKAPPVALHLLSLSQAQPSCLRRLIWSPSIYDAIRVLIPPCCGAGCCFYCSLLVPDLIDFDSGAQQHFLLGPSGCLITGLL
jgi:hypothetical protein